MDNLLGTVFGKLILILGIAAVGALMYAGMSRSKESSVASDLSQIAANVDSFYSGQSTGYVGLTTTVLTDPANALLPGDINAANVTVTSASQSNYGITLALPNGASCNRIWMAIGNVNLNSEATSCATAGSFAALFQ